MTGHRGQHTGQGVQFSCGMAGGHTQQCQLLCASVPECKDTKGHTGWQTPQPSACPAACPATPSPAISQASLLTPLLKRLCQRSPNSKVVRRCGVHTPIPGIRLCGVSQFPSNTHSGSFSPLAWQECNGSSMHSSLLHELQGQDIEMHVPC